MGSSVVIGSVGEQSESEQTVPIDFERSGSVNVEIQPNDAKSLRDQTETFFLKIDVSDSDYEELRIEIKTELNVAEREFKDEDVVPFHLPYPWLKHGAYTVVQDFDSHDTVFVPVSISPENRFQTGRYDVQATVFSLDGRPLDTDEYQLQIPCSLACQTERGIGFIVEYLPEIVAILSLLVAFFGREKIWEMINDLRNRGNGGMEPRSRDEQSDDQPDPTK